MQKTSIPWCTHSWNVTTGCNGPDGKRCPYCYAASMSRRFGRSFEPVTHPEKLDEPLRLKAPARIFVDSNGDLFDPAIDINFIHRVLAVVARCPEHTFICLTKQADRMAQCLSIDNQADVWGWMDIQERFGTCADDSQPGSLEEPGEGPEPQWPLPNLWLGVTAENQTAADERIPLLLQTPAAVRVVSAEPLFGALDLRHYLPHEVHGQSLWPDPITQRFGHYYRKRGLDWMIVGNDSRRGQPLPDPAWVQAIVDQCRAAGVPLFVKGRLAATWPQREYPQEAQ